MRQLLYKPFGFWLLEEHSTLLPHLRQILIRKNTNHNYNYPEEKLADYLQGQKNNIKDKEYNQSDYQKPKKFFVSHLSLKEASFSSA